AGEGSGSPGRPGAATSSKVPVATSPSRPPPDWAPGSSDRPRSRPQVDPGSEDRTPPDRAGSGRARQRRPCGPGMEIHVPPRLRAYVRERHGKAGVAWADALPATGEHLSRRWSLEVIGA